VERNFERVLHEAGFSQLVQIDVEGGKTHNVLIRDIQRHPVTHRPMHVDFYAVDLTEKQQIQIPVQSIGNADALVVGLMVLQALDQVTVEALPRDMPSVIEIDITNLTQENSITVADLPVIEGATYINDPEEAVFTLIATRGAEEIEELDAEIEGDVEPELVDDTDEEDEAADEA
jgi:large subunit ribosomal protein L25